MNRALGARQKLRELRERKGWSREKLAEVAKTSYGQISKLESGERKMTEGWIGRLSDALGVSPQEFFATAAQRTSPQSEQGSALPRTHNPDDNKEIQSSVDLAGHYPLPETDGLLDVFGSIRGGYDGAEVDYQHPVERIPMPSILAGVYKACGCYVINNSMEPAFRHGNIVLVHPGRPVQRGDYVVVELPEHRGIVKRLVRQSDKYVEVEQLNPPEPKRFARSEVVALHLIVGVYFSK